MNLLELQYSDLNPGHYKEKKLTKCCVVNRTKIKMAVSESFGIVYLGWHSSATNATFVLSASEIKCHKLCVICEIQAENELSYFTKFND